MRATKEATSEFFQKLGNVHPSKIRQFDSLSLSALGVGAHLGASDEATDRLYEKVLLEAAQSGVNAFDTALIDRDMRSEKLLGRVLKELSQMGIPREALFVSTKGGYLLNKTLEEVAEPEKVVQEHHCMSPSFLRHQIEISLENLGVETIDLYWLHNPEVELWDLEEEEFYHRLAEVFSFFEQMVLEKKIARYGVASWSGFRAKKKALQIRKVLKAAGENHHLKALFVPVNLVMLEALKVANQEGDRRCIASAFEEGLAFFASSPLMQGQVLDLPDHVFEKLPPEQNRCLQALQFVLSAPGVASAFLSVKQHAHWEEVKSLLSLPDWNEELWKKAKGCL